MLQLKRIRIEGFKALDPIDFRIDGGATFLVGSNGVGKSSILQALSFVRAFGEGSATHILRAEAGIHGISILARVGPI